MYRYKHVHIDKLTKIFNERCGALVTWTLSFNKKMRGSTPYTCNLYFTCFEG